MNSGKIVYDKIIIGTSPLGIFEGHFTPPQKKVLIIDNAKTIGGNWRKIENSYVKNVNMGCHSFFNDEKYYDFLKNVLDCEFSTLTVQPKISYGSLLFSESGLIHKAFQVHSFLKSRFRRKGRRKDHSGTYASPQEKSVRSRVKSFFKIPTPHIYPKNGIEDFLQALERLIQKDNIELSLGEKIVDIKTDGDEMVHVFTDNGRKMSARRLFITQNSFLENNRGGSNFLYPIHKPWKRRFPHLLLIVKDASQTKEVSEITFLNNDFFVRMNEYTRYVKFKRGKRKTDSRVFMFWLRKEKADLEKNQLTEKCVEWLKKSGFVDADAACIESDFLNHEILLNSIENLEEVRRRSGNLIDFLESENLRDGVLHGIKRWKG